MAVRTNTLNVWIEGDVTDVTYALEDHKITEGQTWESDHVSYWNKLLTITIRAGRDNSSDVATWFKDGVGQNGVIAGCGTQLDTKPDELNFAFKGKLSFKHKGQQSILNDVYFGQGNNGRNNWWAGIKLTSMNDLQVNYSYTFSIKQKEDSDDVNEFTLTITITKLA